MSAVPVEASGPPSRSICRWSSAAPQRLRAPTSACCCRCARSCTLCAPATPQGAQRRSWRAFSATDVPMFLKGSGGGRSRGNRLTSQRSSMGVAPELLGMEPRRSPGRSRTAPALIVPWSERSSEALSDDVPAGRWLRRLPAASRFPGAQPTWRERIVIDRLRGRLAGRLIPGVGATSAARPLLRHAGDSPSAAGQSGRPRCWHPPAYPASSTTCPRITPGDARRFFPCSSRRRPSAASNRALIAAAAEVVVAAGRRRRCGSSAVAKSFVCPRPLARPQTCPPESAHPASSAANGLQPPTAVSTRYLVPPGTSSTISISAVQCNKYGYRTNVGFTRRVVEALPGYLYL